MPVTPRGRGRRTGSDIPEIKPGEEEDVGQAKTTKVIPDILQTKLAYGPVGKWSVERRLSTSEEEPTSHDLKTDAHHNEEFIEKQCSETPEKVFVYKKKHDSSPEKHTDPFSETDSNPETQSERNIDSQSETLNTTTESDIDKSESINTTTDSETFNFLHLDTQSELSTSTQSERSSGKTSNDDPLTLFKADLHGKPFLICAAEFLCNPDTTEELVM